MRTITERSRQLFLRLKRFQRSLDYLETKTGTYESSLWTDVRIKTVLLRNFSWKFSLTFITILIEIVIAVSRIK